jgi:hypothetical protein
MDRIKFRRRSTHSTTSTTESAGNETELPSPQEVIDSLGPDAFGKKEPEEGAKDLHKKLTDFAEQSPELSPELVSEEAPEAFFLSAETKLKDVEEDMGREDSNATLDEREDFSKGVTIIHSLFSGEEIPSPTYQPSDEEVEQKIAKAIKQYSSSGPA